MLTSSGALLMSLEKDSPPSLRLAGACRDTVPQLTVFPPPGGLDFDICGHPPPELGHWPGGLGGLRAAHRHLPHPAVSIVGLGPVPHVPRVGDTCRDLSPSLCPCSPHYSILGRIADTDIYRDVAEYQLVTTPGGGRKAA